jgi:hypothetical protein
MPTHRRFKRCATTTLVPQPQNASRTVSPSFDEAEMILSSKASGFCVG